MKNILKITSLLFLFILLIFNSLKAQISNEKIEELKQLAEKSQNEGKNREAFSYYIKIATIYTSNNQFDEAIKYNKIALSIAKSSNSGYEIRLANYNLGNIYLSLEQYGNALEPFENNVKISLKDDKKLNLANDFFNLAFVQRKLKKNNDAIVNLKKALTITQFVVINEEFSHKCYEELANNYLETGNTEKYKEYFDYMQGKEFDKKKELLEYRTNMAESKIQEKEEEIQSKNRIMTIMEDSLIRARQAYKINQLELTNKKLELEKNEKDLAITRYVLYFLIAISVIIGFFLFLIYKQYREKVKMNEQLVKQNKMIEEQSKEIEKQRDEYKKLNITKDKFFSIIAHDLKNPFNTLIGFSEILINESDSMSKDENIEYLTHIYNSSKSTYNLLENLLQWAKSQIKGIEYKPSESNVKEIINNNIVLLNESAKIKNIELLSNIEKDSIAYIDRNMITTVIRNLITNAIKFTNKGGKVTLGLNERDHGVEVSVSDNGVGIKKEALSELFKLDSHHTTEGTEHEMGTGLGLIVCKEFIERNGGKIWVESEVGYGSTFRFTLPKPLNANAL